MYDALLAKSMSDLVSAVAKGQLGVSRIRRSISMDNAEVFRTGPLTTAMSWSRHRILIGLHLSKVDFLKCHRRPLAEGGSVLACLLALYNMPVDCGRRGETYSELVARKALELKSHFRSAPVVFAGWGFAGALSALLAFRLARRGFEVEDLKAYTFESPRIGNRVFQEHYDRLLGDFTFRVVPATRPAPIVRFPPSALGFHHVGRPILLCQDHVLETSEAWNDLRRQTPVSMSRSLTFLCQMRSGERCIQPATLRQALRRHAQDFVNAEQG